MSALLSHFRHCQHHLNTERVTWAVSHCSDKERKLLRVGKTVTSKERDRPPNGHTRMEDREEVRWNMEQEKRANQTRQ